MQLLCLGLVVMRCQPLRRALCTYTVNLPYNSSLNGLWFKLLIYEMFNSIFIHVDYWCCTWRCAAMDEAIKTKQFRFVFFSLWRLSLY
ncbi:hypothetical protein B4935_18590 [Vibrio cholerae]|nr:hypothetical protein [Vibrio cholerae]MCD1235100.1 hypothetical protein [Vibrio cholerae]MCD1242367.1 hypothetical protein [Vibrio cholerae]MCD1257085.1 hypothetical protein [Vibrio cholerae]